MQTVCSQNALRPVLGIRQRPWETDKVAPSLSTRALLKVTMQTVCSQNAPRPGPRVN